MSSRGRLAGVLVAVAAALALVASAPGSGGNGRVSVAVDRAAISTQLGDTFTFRSTITNSSPVAATGLIAHLNVLSLRNGTYVDPEDWSSHRTRYLAPIPAHGSVTIGWPMQAVNSGSFGVYVAVLPRSGGASPPTTGPTIHVAVEAKRTLNSGGILPLAFGIPALLGLLTLMFRLRRGRAAAG